MSKTINERKSQLAALGVDVSAGRFIARLEKIEEKAREKAHNLVTNDGGIANREAADNINAVLGETAVTTVTLLARGIKVGLGGLFVAEVYAVHVGLHVIMPLWESYVYSAVALTALYLLMFLQEALAQFASLRYEWSWALWRKRFVYQLGFGRNFELHEKHIGAEMYKAVEFTVKLLMISLVCLAVLGRLKSVVTTDEVMQMNAVDGLQHIIFTTPLPVALGSILTGVLTAALLLGSHAFFNFLYVNFDRVTGGGVSFAAPKSAAQIEIERGEIIEAEIVDYLDSVLMTEHQKALPSTINSVSN